MWLQQHASLISALASAGALVIWTMYAWLFYEIFRRERSSKLFIHQTGSRDPSAMCLLVNLSREPVHVLRSLAVRDGATAQLHDASGDESLSFTQRAMQGPLQPGGSMLLGSFGDICAELDARQSQPPEDAGQAVEIRVAALHGFRQWPVGARRLFRVNRHASEVAPTKNITDQLHSRRDASEVQEWLDEP